MYLRCPQYYYNVSLIVQYELKVLYLNKGPMIYICQTMLLFAKPVTSMFVPMNNLYKVNTH